MWHFLVILTYFLVLRLNYVLSGRPDYCVGFAIHLPKNNIKKFNKSVLLKTDIKSINNKQTHARCKRNVRVNCLGDIAP